MMDRFWNRQYDERTAARNNRKIVGWIVMLGLSASVLGVNLYLLIAHPTVGLGHTIFGLIFGTILVVGTTANLMGKFYDNG